MSTPRGRLITFVGEYDVIEDSTFAEHGKDDCTFGEVSFRNRLIRIVPNLKPVEVCQTIMHELGHIWVYASMLPRKFERKNDALLDRLAWLETDFHRHKENQWIIDLARQQ